MLLQRLFCRIYIIVKAPAAQKYTPPTILFSKLELLILPLNSTS